MMNIPAPVLFLHAFPGYTALTSDLTAKEIESFSSEKRGSLQPLPPDGQKLRRHGFRWRTLRTVSIGLKPVVLRVKVPRWQNTTTGEEFEQSPPLPSRIRKSPARSRG